MEQRQAVEETLPIDSIYLFKYFSEKCTHLRIYILHPISFGHLY